MKYNKLVRDKIPAYIRKRGGTAKTHIATRAEYGKKLIEKLKEEITEFEENESMEEFADILEVLDAIAKYKKFRPGHVQRLKKQKATARGRFVKRIILEESKAVGP